MLSNIVFLLGAALTAAQAVPPAGTVITQCSRPGVMALTFDDGPYIYEQQLVQRLNAAGAKATFFVTGRCTTASTAKRKRHVSPSRPGTRSARTPGRTQIYPH